MNVFLLFIPMNLISKTKLVMLKIRAVDGTSTPSVMYLVNVTVDMTWGGIKSKINHVWTLFSYIYPFSKMQCDLKVNVDCTEYELYYFPDGEDVRVFESLHGNNEIESPSSQSKAKTAFCLYMDG